jgi:antitoxin VapB
MALSIKDPEAERLVTEVAALAHENKTQAVRNALRERKDRLELAQGAGPRRRRLLQVLESDIWPTIPPEAQGHRLSKAEDERVLGLGPDGV